MSAAALAWMLLLPCALLTAIAIALLGPPVGHALFPSGSDELWPRDWWEAEGHAEPAKQGRYVLAVLAPLVMAAAILVGSRRDLRLRSSTVRAIVWIGHAMTLAVVAIALLDQNLIFEPRDPAPPLFGVGTVLVAGALVSIGIVLMRRRDMQDWVAARALETKTRRGAGLAFAAFFAAIWLLKAVTTDGLSGDIAGLNLPYTFNDALAVLNGRTPLVDYHGIYAKLLPYPTAVVLHAFGTTIFVYSTWMAVLAGLALVAVYALFRLVTRSSLLALALFVPFVATSDLRNLPISAGELSPIRLSAMWPMRYGGVYLLAWLTARHLAGLRPQGTWVLFLVGTLVAVNSLEFGLGALVATLIALLCARPPRSMNAALRLSAHAAGGIFGAIALVSLFTVARAGALPSLDLLLEWPRVFSTLGWFSLPLPTSGVHLALYATFAAAVVVAAVRLSQSEDDVLLTGMLAWSGVFGLLAAGYYVGRPDTLKLEGMLSAWAFALALLTVACVRGLIAQRWQRPTLPHLLVLFGFGLSICSLGQIPLPSEEIARLTGPQPDPVYLTAVSKVIDKRTEPGETVAILVPMSYRIAHDLGLRNVAPYPFMNAIVTRSQMQTLIDTIRRERVRRIFLPDPGHYLLQEGNSAPQHVARLLAMGFRRVSSDPAVAALTKER